MNVKHLTSSRQCHTDIKSPSAGASRTTVRAPGGGLWSTGSLGTGFELPGTKCDIVKLLTFSIGLTVVAVVLLVALLSLNAGASAVYAVPNAGHELTANAATAITPTVLAIVTVGNDPQAVGVNPTTNHIYAAHYDSNTVPVIADPIHTDLELSMDYALYATSEITFTVVVSNAGPNAAGGTVVSNTVSVNLTGATGNCVASGGASCSADSSGSMTVTNFPVGGVATYTLHGMLANRNYFENTATVSPPVGTTDPNMGNNSVTIGRSPQLLFPILRNYPAP